MDKEISFTQEEWLKRYIELTSGGISTLHFIPLGMKANQTALSTLCENIAKKDKDTEKAFEALFFRK